MSHYDWIVYDEGILCHRIVIVKGEGKCATLFGQMDEGKCVTLLG